MHVHPTSLKFALSDFQQSNTSLDELRIEDIERGHSIESCHSVRIPRLKNTSQIFMIHGDQLPSSDLKILCVRPQGSQTSKAGRKYLQRHCPIVHYDMIITVRSATHHLPFS